MAGEGATDPVALRELVARIAREIARDERDGAGTEAWPQRTMRALGDAGLLGLLVPRDAGGLGGGFSELVIACEELGREYPSAGLVFGMHSVGAACIAARATPAQKTQYLEPIAAGEHVTTLAVSEAGSGVHFYLPQLGIRRDGDGFIVSGKKTFVTNAGHADSYVVSTASLASEDDPGRFNLLVVDADTSGLAVGSPWEGLGMRGNDARSLTFTDVSVPTGNLLGEEGAETWYMFEVLAPYFLVAMAGTYLGVTARAVEEATSDLASRTYALTGGTTGDAPVLQDLLARIWMEAEQARGLLYHAARSADAGTADASRSIMAAKATLDEVAVDVTREALGIAGGRAYRANGLLATLHRDALASQVMAPTAPLLRAWIARSLLGLPLLGEDAK